MKNFLIHNRRLFLLFALVSLPYACLPVLLDSKTCFTCDTFTLKTAMGYLILTLFTDVIAAYLCNVFFNLIRKGSRQSRLFFSMLCAWIVGMVAIFMGVLYISAYLMLAIIVLYFASGMLTKSGGQKSEA